MRDWWPSDGLRVNAGRKPARVGGDRIAPFLDVPHWFTADIVRMLRRQRRCHSRTGAPATSATPACASAGQSNEVPVGPLHQP